MDWVPRNSSNSAKVQKNDVNEHSEKEKIVLNIFILHKQEIENPDHCRVQNTRTRKLNATCSSQ